MKGKINASGTRKKSRARAIIYPGNGKVTINKKNYEFLPEIRRLMIQEPLNITKDVLGKISFDVEVNVSGGGIESRIESARLAIARALVKITKSKKLRDAFIQYDRNLLVADIRNKESNKPGISKARKKRQKSFR